jgi:menaquinone reductase, molybdopterin-binding-like subunit
MQRRDFIKISAVTGATTALDACGHPEHQLIRFVPEEDLVPGVAAWKPSICTLCPAGCGLMVRVMEGEAEMVRNGQLGLIKMGLAKKLEGNPNHPISQGKLCPRGQAGLQITYHPDRIKNPLKRSGPRGSGQFREISWDEAMRDLVSELQALRSDARSLTLAAPRQPAGGGSVVFLSRPLRGQRRKLVEQFLQLFPAASPLYFEALDQAPLRHANMYSFGYGRLPTFDLANANYVVSFGADFLGTWNSPVAQSVGYGQMRQGRAGQRGKHVQFEPRMSLTGANADEWMPVKPGTEGALALGLAHVIIKEKPGRAKDAGRAGALIAGWSEGLPAYSPEAAETKTGVPAARVSRIALEMASHPPAIALVGGAPLAQTNGFFNALAVNALNALLGNIGQSGGIFFTPQALRPGYFFEAPAPFGNIATIDRLIQPLLEGRPRAARALILYEANPVFALPASCRVREALEKIPFIMSFGNFIDETSVLADLVLPDHSPLESWLDDIPESGSKLAVVSVAPPAMRPLYNTRAMPDVLLEVAHQLDGEMIQRMPWKTYEELLRSSLEELQAHKGSVEAASSDDFWSKAQEQGGWWSDEVRERPQREFLTMPIAKSGAPPEGPWWRTAKSVSPQEAMVAPAPAEFREPEFDGDTKEFPFNFLPYPTQLLGDGSLAHLPWLQETPDPLSTAMWGTWVEINPKTAERLGIQQGDLLEVASQHGKLQAPALIYPGIAPDVVAMPVGQGHANFTRYASGRGANPISILAPVFTPEVGSLAWAATRVKIARLGEGKLVLFGAELREKPEQHR